MKIKAILFDCDGLMFNTEEVSQNMWRDEAKKYGVTLSDEFFKRITGAKKNVDVSDFERDIPHFHEIREAMREKRFDLTYWASFYPNGLTKKGLVELKQFLDASNIKTAVCSSSSKKYVETLIQTIPTELHFDAIVGGDMVKNGKPDPEIFLTGAKTLEVDPKDCMVLEDSKQGVFAARAAGMISCIIPDTIEIDEEMKPAIDYQCESLLDVIKLLKEEL